jgi:hypothetical protein
MVYGTYITSYKDSIHMKFTNQLITGGHIVEIFHFLYDEKRWVDVYYVLLCLLDIWLLLNRWSYLMFTMFTAQ